MTESQEWDLIRVLANQLELRDVRRLRRITGLILKRRAANREALNERAREGFAGLANAMAGVAWALACRNALREWKGHRPLGGTRPASGEMWLPWELMKARAYALAKYDCCVLTVTDWTQARNCIEQVNRYRLADQQPTAAKFVIPLTKRTMERTEARVAITTKALEAFNS